MAVHSAHGHAHPLPLENSAMVAGITIPVLTEVRQMSGVMKNPVLILYRECGIIMILKD